MDLTSLQAALENKKQEIIENVPAPISSERRAILGETLTNIQPLLDLNNDTIKQALTLVDRNNNQETIIVIRQNKSKNRGFYLCKQGVFCLATGDADVKRITLNERIFAFMNEEIIDDMNFVHPKWWNNVQERVDEVVSEVEGLLMGAKPPPVEIPVKKVESKFKINFK